ncbi:MAG: cyclopropane fatty acyl phospholipid synthase [Chlorobi bacterium]|nr:cyclopropane fatty acyl phospholipid synthase [Chlorobiota bacterium]
MTPKQKIAELLNLADVRINGQRPWDIQVHNEALYSRLLSGGSLALGESYMAGWWDCDVPDEFFYRIINADLKNKVSKSFSLLFLSLRARLTNMQKKSRAFNIGKKHYDTGNLLFENMLDKNMNYSCGYWKNTDNLDQAQLDKMELICRKLMLKPGMKLLDIGCGWGTLAKYAAENYKVKVTGITVSEKQAGYAKRLVKGLDVDILLEDYRNIRGQFDRIVSVGMIEHVGYKNYRTFFKKAVSCLRDNGLFLLHTIGNNFSVRQTDPWINKYIFPDSMLPSAKQLTAAYEGLFRMEDWHSFGTHYDKTLMTWYRNFNNNWEKIKSRYDERFRRMWNYYLLSSAGSFRAHDNQLWQIVLSGINSQIDYESVR